MATNTSNVNSHLFSLADEDREAITRIRERLVLNSNVHAVMLAIRDLARTLLHKVMEVRGVKTLDLTNLLYKRKVQDGQPR